jgi:tRNA 5-methylaminomethyl-2-thiouridine biosynthesis bifunctional protein
MMGHAGVVVVANGAGVFGRPWARGLQLKRVRGQVTHVDAGAVGVQDWVVCGDGYVIPAVEGVVSVGATYDFTETSGELLASCGVENLARLPALLPGEETTPELNGHFACKGRVGFRTLSADRLPVIGALPDCERIAAGGRLERLGDIPRLDGFFGVLGLGSRGILWSGLVAECLASGIVGEPLPLERELVEAMDPARWILRGLRSRK